MATQFKISISPPLPPASVYVNFKRDNVDSASAISYLGTNVYSNLVFQAGSYINENNETIDYDGLEIDTVVMNVVQNKNIIVTPVQGRPGTIKEYISDGDFDINITGMISSGVPSAYPEEDVKRLIELFKVSDSLKVTATFLNRLGIFDIVIKSYTLNQSEGRYGTQPFTISAISDTPLILLSNNA